MQAVVWHGVGEISLDEVPDPTIRGRRLAAKGRPRREAGRVAYRTFDQRATGWTKVALDLSR